MVSRTAGDASCSIIYKSGNTGIAYGSRWAIAAVGCCTIAHTARAAAIGVTRNAGRADTINGFVACSTNSAFHSSGATTTAGLAIGHRWVADACGVAISARIAIKIVIGEARIALVVAFGSGLASTGAFDAAIVPTRTGTGRVVIVASLTGVVCC